MTTPSKFIREGRMGPPLSWKTGAVVGTYPRPLLVFEFDIGGLDVIKDPVLRIQPSELSKYCKTPQAELPPLMALDFAVLNKRPFDLNVKTYDSMPALNFLDCVNMLIQQGCPWKTVVVDQLTGLASAFIGYIGITNSAAMNDARQWASQVGVLTERAIMCIQGLQAHTVFIMHVETDKNEITGEILTEPMIPSKFRQRAATAFSQFFYAAIEGGKPIVYAQPTGFVKSVGMRRPEASPAKMGATFSDIYGKDYQ